MYEALAEDNDPHQGDARADEVHGVGHPDGGDTEHEVAQCTTSDGCYYSHDVGTE